MTFRDDHDAALARAAALEEEVERTKRERDELAAKVKALEVENRVGKASVEREAKRAAKEERKQEKARAKQEKRRRASSSSDSDDESKAGKFALIFTALTIGPIIIWVAVRSCNYEKDRDVWEAKTAERKAHETRWRAMVSVEPCLRRLASEAVRARRSAPGGADAQKGHSYGIGQFGHCLHDIDKLIADPKTQPAMRTALQLIDGVQKQLNDAGKPLHTYYSNGDWREDNFASAPALWAPVLELLQRQVAVFAQVRRDALPAIRDEIRGLQKKHEATAGKDETWWRVELALRFWEINDRAYEAAGTYAGREPDYAAAVSAVRDLVVKTIETTKQAPIEVRRIVRKVDWVVGQIAEGGPLRGETPLWHLASDTDDDLIGWAQQKVIPAMPPDPGPRPENPNAD
jgi:hypothetical protein